MSESAELELTVAVIVGAARERAQDSIRHLLRQTALERIEIVCVDIVADPIPFPELNHPRLRYIHAPTCRYFDEAMARCLHEARAPLIAFIEDHSYAQPDWAGAILRAFGRPDVAMVNYAFTHGGDGTYLDRAFLVTEYGRWMAPAVEGSVFIASCNNIAYRKEALAPFWDSLLEWLEVAPALHAEIQRQGGVVWLAADAVVAHEGWSTLRAGCWANGVMKRWYGAARAEHGDWGFGRRLFYAAAMTIAPALHLARLAWSFRDRPRLWGRLLTAMPVAIPTYVYSSFQEAKGYVAGAGTSREDFTSMELAVPRRP